MYGEPVETLSAGCGHAILNIGYPEWRNWQTQQTQNLPKLCFVWVRLPPPGPSISTPRAMTLSFYFPAW